ncbi:MAG: radical SAM protein [Deltaproteobacteria bacterium]|nr:radical SAM protein [Deltaproteobacteria bacterium]
MVNRIIRKVDLSTAHRRVVDGYGAVAKAVHPRVTLPPLRVTFEVTYRCNLACSFCFQEVAREESPEFRKQYELSNDEISSIVDELPKTSFVTLNGGEVFVRKDFPELLARLTERGRAFNLVTNGTMLFEDKAKLLVDEVKALSVGFSIDGVAETHDRIRKLPKAFDRTVENLTRLAEYRNRRNAKLPVLDMKTVMTGENIGQLIELYELARKIGVDYFTLSCLRTSDLILSLPCREEMDESIYTYPRPIADDVDLGVFEAQLRRLFALAARNDRPKLRFYPTYSNVEGILKYYANRGSLDDYEPCDAPWTNIRIAPNGDVYPCLAYKMGSVRDGSLMASWKGQRMNRFREILRDGLVPSCVGCCFLKAKAGIPFDVRGELEFAEPGQERISREAPIGAGSAGGVAADPVAGQSAMDNSQAR